MIGAPSVAVPAGSFLICVIVRGLVMRVAMRMRVAIGMRMVMGMRMVVEMGMIVDD
jgi:hypothetical protein